MRILHVANFSWFTRRSKRKDNLARHYATERKLSAGLVREGHYVWDFSYRDTARHYSLLGKKYGKRRMHTALLELAQAFRPDLILLGHVELIPAEILSRMRALLPGTPIAQWWVDPFWPHEIAHLRERVPLLDAFFSTSGPAHARASLGHPKVPVFFMPNPVDPSVEIHRAFEQPCDYDVFFAAAATPERLALTDRLRMEFPNLRLKFCGLTKDYIGSVELHEMIGKSRTGLNMSQFSDVPYYTSARMAQLTGNGCLALSPHTPGMEELYSPDEVAYYHDTDELIELIKRLTADEAARQQKARAGWERAHRDYNSQRVGRFLLEAIHQEGYSEKYGWEHFEPSA